MSSSSASSSGFQRSSRPQQHGLASNDQRSILRQRPGDVLEVRHGNHHQRSYHSTPTTLSPFLSPASSFGLQREQLPPLVLDPSASRNSNFVVSDALDRGHNNNFTVFSKLWQVAGGGGGKQPTHVHHHHNQPQKPHPQTESLVIVPEETAGHFARQAPRAGFLQKLGTTIPEFKRRFFVLQPGTHLYYFLSPNDTEPRGCFDLDGSRVEEVDNLPDGRYRFALVWDGHRIVLEARSKEVGQEWIKSLESERMSFARAEIQELQRQNDVLRFRLSDLERKVEDYKLLENDRDAAIDEAARWKEKFERLDDALRLLTQQINQPESMDDEGEGETNLKTSSGDNNGEQKPCDDNQSASNNENDVSRDESQSLLNTSCRDTSLLDSVADDEPTTDEVPVPGSHFTMLSNACQQLTDNFRLSTLENLTTSKDLSVANEKVLALEKRLGRAEKHLCKLWEENCSIHKALKQKKQEKKILVREYKSLFLANSALQAAAGKPMRNGQLNAAYRDSHLVSNLDVSLDDGSVMTASDEDKLMNEIEESIVSSIRIHEQFLGAPVKAVERSAKLGKNRTQATSNVSLLRKSNVSNVNGANSSEPSTNQLQSKLSSLFDESEESDDNSSVAPSLVSSVGADDGDTVQRSDKESPARSIHEDDQVNPKSRPDTPERLNPIQQLDMDEDDDDESSKPNLCAASSQSESSKSVITDNGRATSRLACPLADVIPTQDFGGNHDLSESTQDGRVYHLTFYTRKIGIQFQKVPPPTAPIGLLTEAMRVELGADPADGLKTAAELRREPESNYEDFCKVASPVDAVLVCGLDGFDDAANRMRPKLGARLVAFDGISVEVGQWTFDSIRKAIQARSRPLTLSFRNDFLTTEQRSVLTKAITEGASSAAIPPRASINYSITSRPSSTDPSVNSALSHESDYFVNQYDSDRGTYNDDVSSSAASEHSYPPSRSSFSASNRTPRAGNFHSFSEAGSSSVLSSAFAPLMANLMAGLAKKQPNASFTPEYLKRESGSLDKTPQHHDFKANLL